MINATRNCWYRMKQRCHNPNNPDYKNYGAKGIFVCEEWVNNFENFIKYIGPKPSRKHSIDRIDGSKGYEPGNVRWATKIIQNTNRRNVTIVKYNSKNISLLKYCKIKNLDYNAMRERLKLGESIEHASKHTVKGINLVHKTTPKIEELSSRLGVPRNTLYQWRKRGVPYRWRITLVQASGGAIQLSDFPDAHTNDNDGRP